MAAWTQLYVKAPEGNSYTNSDAMKRIDDHLLQSTPACFTSPYGRPLQEPDGTWEVRVMDKAAAPIVKALLTMHYGLEIVSEVSHD